MRRMFIRPAAIFAALFLCFFTAPSARADTTASPDPDDAVQAFAAPETFETALAKAQAGDAKAQCALGVAYINGTSVPQNFGQGLHWLHRSSEAGYGYARYVLADLYSRGYGGVPVSDAQAYYFASLAAASSSLPEKFREKAVKLRNASARRLSPAELTGLQAKAALAPLDAAAGN
jgi:TPR repeat protein